MKKSTLILLGLIALGFFLRIYKITTIPAGIDWDEASFGYNAYSIAKTGMDEWGKKLPLLFTAFGDFKLPTYIYLTALVMRFFELSVLTIRIVPVIMNTFSILILYALTKRVTLNKNIALLSALFLTVSPYGLFYSRIGLDISLVSFFILFGLLYEMKFIGQQKTRYITISTMAFMISFFTYNLARVITPLLLIGFFFLHIFVLKIKIKQLVIPVFMMIIILIVTLPQLRSGGASRMMFVGMFGEEKSVTLDINEFRDHDKNNLLSKILHNKATFFTSQLLENYVGHFSSSFLSHSSPPSAVQISPYGPLYPVQLPFYFLGLVSLVALLIHEKDVKKRAGYLIMLLWVVLSPLPSIITEGSISRRYLGALGSWELLSALGIYAIYRKMQSSVSKKSFITITASLYLLSIFFFLRFYFYDLSLYRNVYFYQQNLMGKYVARNYENFDRFVISKKTTGEPHIFVLFFSKFNPATYRKTKQAVWENNWVNVKGFDKTVYPEEITNEILQSVDSSEKIMIILTYDELSRHIETIKKRSLTATPLDKENKDNHALYVITKRI